MLRRSRRSLAPTRERGTRGKRVADGVRLPLTIGSDPIIAPTAHDLFDAGLWTIDGDLRIRVAQSDIAESILSGGSHFKLADLHGRRLSFAPQATLRPDPTHLALHRREIFAHYPAATPY